jgi:2-methylcitrate dehydratase PrpD
LGKEWEILGLYFKVYSMCRSGHSAIDGVIEIAREHKVNVNDISQITIGTTPKRGGRMANYRPANIWQAQYSIPFAIGAALVDGEVGPRQMAEDRLEDREILRQADKVKFVADDEVGALFPGARAAKVEVEMQDGRKFQTFIQRPKGDPENPHTEDELKEKFMKLVSQMIGTRRAEDLYMCLEKIEKLDNVKELVEKIRYFG